MTDATVGPDGVLAPADEDVLAEDGRKVLPFVFSGQTTEYFGIWIVNLLLSVLTIGIYSAWAKVRTNRYFYGNTSIGGVSLEYHARPRQILIGRAIAVVFYAGYSYLTSTYLYAGIAFIPVFMIVIPWVIVRSLRFNARMTSWRNVRFNFVGTYPRAFMAFVIWPLIGALTLGLLWPLAAKKIQAFLVDNVRFGGKAFKAHFTTSDFYRIYALVLALVLGGIAAIVAIFAMQYVAGGALAVFFFSIFEILALVVFVGILTLGIFVSTLVTNLTFNTAQVEGGHGFRSTMSPWVRIWISVSNLFLVAISIGLLYPLARMRQVRYRASQTYVLAASDLTEFTSEILEGQGVIGEEIGEIFDIEIGF